MSTRQKNYQSVFIFFGITIFTITAQNCSQENFQSNESSSITLRTHFDKQKLITEIEQLIPQLMDSADVPGLTIAVIRDAEIMWNSSYGVKSLETNEAINDSMIFQAASLSKTVFAYAVLKLVEAGILDLDTPLSNYLPKKYIESDERIDQITARRVMSHTTGFPNWRPRGGDLKIHFTPGEKFSYSGEGFVYLQKVVEHLTGKSLTDFMIETVFEPLGMHNSSYVWLEKYEPNYAIGHAEFGVAIKRDHMTKANAAASLYTTALDYAKYVNAILQGTGLKNATLKEMLTSQIQLDKNCVNCIQNDSAELSEVNSWGLGWGLQNTKEGTSFWHWGDQGIYRCYIVAFEKQKIGVVYFTNSENGLSIRDEIVQAAIGGEHPAFAWLNYDSYKSPVKKFAKAIINNGIEHALNLYNSLKSERQDDSPVFEESAMNRLGYHFMRSRQMDEAIAVFKVNVQDYPDSWNVYDSLGEAYMENGQKDLAIQNYKKSLELNPDNTQGKEMLEKLSGK